MARLFHAIHKIEEWVLATAMILIALLTIANVLTRSLLGLSLAFAEELTGFLIVLITFVGLSYAASRGRHIRMTALYDQLPLRPRRRLMILITVVMALLMVLLAWLSIQYLLVLARLGSVSPTLRAPLYLVYLAAPLGFVLAAVQYALAAWRNLTRPDKVWLSWERTDEYGEELDRTEEGAQPI